MPDAHNWPNRIVRSATVNPRELLAHPRNWRAHPDAQRAALAGALNDLGWVKSITVQESTGLIIDGHLRLAIALERGETEVPVEYVDLNDEEALEALALIDPITAMAETDTAALDALLAEIQTDEPALAALFHELAGNVVTQPVPAVDEPEPPESFPSYDEAIETDYCCPRCGYEWSGKPR